MRRMILILAAVVLVVAALGYALRGAVALRLVEIVMDRNLGENPLEDFDDGLHVILCGAGGPLPDPSRTRSGPCAAVVAGEKLYLVDAGGDSARHLGEMQLPPGLVEAVFLTHFHSDHIDGLGELATLRWAGNANEAPLPVYGPPGVAGVVDGFNRAYRLDVGYRIAHHGEKTVPPSGAGLAAERFEPALAGAPVTVFDADGLRVMSFLVEHEPVAPAVGYRFEYAGRTAVFSGDTKKSAAVVRNAKRADLLVHEALSARLIGLFREVAKRKQVENMRKILLDIPDYHTTPVEAAEVAQEAGVGHLLYTHVVPPLPAPGLDVIFLEGVSDAYSGGVTLGVDGTMISLPANSDAIHVSSR